MKSGEDVQQDAPAAGNARAPEEQADRSDRWTVVKEWSGGPGSLETDRFTTTGTFRVAWTLTDLGRGGIMDLFVRNDAGKLIRSGVSLQAKETRGEYGSGAGHLEVPGGPGTYYLEIRSTGVEWRVAVEKRSSDR